VQQEKSPPPVVFRTLTPFRHMHPQKHFSVFPPPSLSSPSFSCPNLRSTVFGYSLALPHVTIGQRDSSCYLSSVLISFSFTGFPPSTKSLPCALVRVRHNLFRNVHESTVPLFPFFSCLSSVFPALMRTRPRPSLLCTLFFCLSQFLSHSGIFLSHFRVCGHPVLCCGSSYLTPFFSNGSKYAHGSIRPRPVQYDITFSTVPLSLPE